jgi:hypothetical protein
MTRMPDPRSFPAPQDFGCRDLNAEYDPETGHYHYTYYDPDANARISFDVDYQGNYVSGLHMVDQTSGEVHR